jgi:periplasmic divalent cation tolerance protein
MEVAAAGARGPFGLGRAMAVVVVFSTFPTPEQASVVARTLVGEKLAACVNIVQGVQSIYRWKGEVQDDREALAVIKTTESQLPALIARLIALHPYELPEAIAVPVVGGHAPYLAWVASG